MKTNLDFSIKHPIRIDISLFFSYHYFQNRTPSRNISSSRAIKNISIKNVKSIIKTRLDTLVSHKGRYLFSLYTDSTYTDKAYFLIVSENRNIQNNALNFVVVSAATSSNLKIKFQNIFYSNRFFIDDFTCEDLINQEKSEAKKREQAQEASIIKNPVKKSLKLSNTLTERKNIRLVEKSSAIVANVKTQANISIDHSSEPTRSYRATPPNNHFSQVENRFLAIEKRLLKNKIPFNISKTLSIGYLNYLEYLITKFGQSAMSKGSYESILTTSYNLRNLLTDKAAA